MGNPIIDRKSVDNKPGIPMLANVPSSPVGTLAHLLDGVYADIIHLMRYALTCCLCFSDISLGYQGGGRSTPKSSGSRMELDSGISETEGSGLLRDDDLSLEVKRSCWDWCIGHNIECIEACAANADFDKCMAF
ncbi:hypothetical protein HAX54_005054 [Datura stramonium]|uniref:Uncharacterized protein n=1 Tax=Datura stramonium TaxID=4076 RepID=A0ABS8WVA0_DATST|nr:hypothetical protein [Datura stramonium]